LPESNLNGIVVAEGPGADQSIARLPTAVTAFVGRTLRGPVNRPVAVRSFADFQQVFGGLWQPSPMPYAVEQFFESGGRRAVIVRVINGGRSATITLPCGPQSLTLEALSPGSREALRASVDYDNIGPGEEDRFNLVVQRVRTIGSEHIEDQEIFRRLSVVPGTARHVLTALQESTLVRVLGVVPAQRPDRTFRAGSRHPIGYVVSNPDGDDGEPLTDYDLIGSPERGTGLFALRSASDVHFVCIPPPARDRDVGPSVLVVAARLCRDLRAMLIVDPPAAWETCDQALQGLRELDFQSGQALMCYPRIQAYDRLRSRYETFANCGAVAGVLARLDEQRSPWHAGPDDELLLRPGTRATQVLSESERSRLVAHGVNPLQSLRSANPQSRELRTLAGGTGRNSDSALLTPRRRALLIMNSIERGTRWAVFEAADRRTWLRVTRQVQEFLEPLDAAGLFGTGSSEDGFHVACDERINSAEDVAAGRVNILVGLRAARAGEHRSFLVTHSPEGSRVRPVRSNWLPAGTRMSVRGATEAARPDTARQRTVAQELFGHYAEPRSGASATAAVARRPEPAAARRLDLETVARVNADFGRRGQDL
jgi:phage tail sheath protein FI